MDAPLGDETAGGQGPYFLGGSEWAWFWGSMRHGRRKIRAGLRLLKCRPPGGGWFARLPLTSDSLASPFLPWWSLGVPWARRQIPLHCWPPLRASAADRSMLLPWTCRWPTRPSVAADAPTTQFPKRTADASAERIPPARLVRASSVTCFVNASQTPDIP